MNNNFKNSILRIKRWFKEDIEAIKEKFKNSNMVKKYKENKLKFILIRVSILLIFILIFSGLYYLNEVAIFNENIVGPKATKLELDNGIYYTGDIENGKIQGKGIITISTSNFEMTLNGTFKEVPEETNLIEIGEFEEGSILIKDLTNNYEYLWEGSFEKYTLKNGKIKITKNNKYIEYTGSFINNKLHGIGTRKVNVDGATQEITGWFEKGILKEN